MRRPLDGLALLPYGHRLGFLTETQTLLAQIRSSLPSRTPGARRGNMPVWYPSTKMRCIIKAESAKVEFPFLLHAEHDEDTLEVWDQPPPIPLEYRDRHHHLQRPMHTADYFLFRSASAGWVECKPTQELVKQAETRPNRYRLDEQGTWRCPPGEAFAAKYGLRYEVWASDQVNWAAQDNALYLEDYYQDLERLSIPEAALALLHRLVDEHPGIFLSDLRAAAPQVPGDLVHIAIAKHALYVDLATYRLSEPWHTPVFRHRQAAQAHPVPVPRISKYLSPSGVMNRKPRKSIVWYREQWLALLKAHPEATRKQLMLLLPGVYVRLAHSDRVWLDQHLPPPRNPKSGKQNMLPIKAEPRTLGFRRQVPEDAELAAIVRATAQLFLEDPERPVEITKKRLWLAIPPLSVLRLRNGGIRFPLTACAVEECRDTRRGLGLRRIRWAVLRYAEEQVYPTRRQFERRAGCRDMGAIPGIREAVDEALQTLEALKGDGLALARA